MSSISHVHIELSYYPDGCVQLDIDWSDQVGPGSFHENLHANVVPSQALHYAAMIVRRLQETEDTVELQYEQMAFPDVGPFPPSDLDGGLI